MLRELALPVLGELREVLRETAQLAVPVGADVLYVERLESSDAGTTFHTELRVAARVSGTLARS